MSVKASSAIPRLSLLGSFVLEIKGISVRLPTRKAEALLAYLVLHRGVHSRERIAALFWGDSPDELARRSLRTALSILRKELGEEIVLADRETTQLNPDFPIWVDVLEMEKQAQETLTLDPDIYQGDLLQDFYDEWVLEEREHYREIFIKSLQQNIQILKAQGEYPRALALAQKILSIDPTDEQAYQHVIFCQHALGNRSEALKSYEECARQLMQQLGVEPSEETIALYEQVKRSTTGNTRWAASNLPNPLTSFVGREHELKTLTEIFNTTRLLTLTGVGGCGKTRLAIQLASQLAHQFADGARWIELAAIQDGASLLPAMMKSLGIAENQTDSPDEVLVRFLRSQRMLLVMDNCEHVIAACARVVEHILSQCPHIRILTTSREALGIHGEIAWLVPSLSLPDTDHTADLLNFECPRLFLERASTYRPDLHLNEDNTKSLLRICHALEGIPLAIELAAARVKTLSLEQLASRLDDKLNLLTTGSRVAQPRQQTLRATIDWSYDLLSYEEQIVLQRLSVFYGTWTLEAAEFVCSDNEIDQSEVLDLITHLLDKSLLVSDISNSISTNHNGEIRYRMLEIVRQYAFEKLESTENTESIRDRHLQYYSELAQQTRPAWFTKQQAALIKQFDADYANIRVALAWGLDNPQRKVTWKYGVKLALSLAPFWNFIAEYNEGKSWLKKAIDEINVYWAESGSISGERNGFLSLKAKTLYAYGFLIWFQSFYTQAHLVFLECSEIFRELTDETGLAHANIFLAHSTWGLGEHAAARRMWAQALEQFDKTGDLWGAGMAHSFLGRAEREAENYDQAEYHYDRCVQLFEAAGDDWGLSIGVGHQGMLAFQRNDPARALSLFERRLALSRPMGFKQSIAYAIFLTGMAAWKLGDTARVKKNMLEAMIYFYEIGNNITLSECLLGLAWVAAQENDFERSAWLLGAVMKADESDRVRMGFEENYFHKPLMNELQTVLQDKKLHAVLEKGRNATMDQVVNQAARD